MGTCGAMGTGGDGDRNRISQVIGVKEEVGTEQDNSWLSE